MRQWQVQVACFVYTLASLWGTMWISDEYNELRSLFYGYFALPLATLFFASVCLYPQYWRKRVRGHHCAVVVLVLGLAWGNVLLLNALTASRPVVYTTVFKADHNDRTLKLAYKEGGLGLFYAKRW